MSNKTPSKGRKKSESYLNETENKSKKVTMEEWQQGLNERDEVIRSMNILIISQRQRINNLEQALAQSGK